MFYVSDGSVFRVFSAAYFRFMVQTDGWTDGRTSALLNAPTLISGGIKSDPTPGVERM